MATLPLSAQASPAVGTWTQTDVNSATTKGVAYIDTQQNPNGSYGSGPFFSNTGMALVAYSVVANGSFGNLSLTYQAHVKKAITYLLTNQGGGGDWADFGFFQTYSTGIALAGLSAFQTVDPGIPGAITNGRAFLVNHFQGPVYTGCSSADGSPTANYCGGWNYDTGIGRSDESNTGYAMFGLQLTGGVPGSISSVNIGWQHHVQEISTNPFASRNDGGGGYEPGINGGAFSSNANDTGTMLFGLGYDSVAVADPHVQAGLKLGQDVLDTYELGAPAQRNMVYHSGTIEDGSCLPGSLTCDWNLSGFEGGYHYSIFSLTKGLGEYIPPVLNDPTNWYAKVVDLLLTEQTLDGSWTPDGRDDANRVIATAFAVSALGLVAVEAPISNATGVPFSATEGTNSCGAVATFTDSDSKAVATDYTATIDWKDGTTTAGTITAQGNGSFTVSGCHTYAEEGSKTITVTITDADMSSNTATVTPTATIGDAALTASCATPTATATAFAGATATFTDASTTGTLTDFTIAPGGATIDWGDSTTSAGTVTGAGGTAQYTVSGAHTYTTSGTFTITTTITDAGGSTTSVRCSLLVVAFAPGGGSFVIGDKEHATGTHVMFWGAQWWKNNSTSNPSKAPSFKGFAESPTTPSCGTGWSADPGNSTPPPSGPLPTFMAVIVTDSYAQSGSTVSGDTVHIVIVHTDSGYQANPGHPGRGTVVAQVC